jgi:hypothetical protein
MCLLRGAPGLDRELADGTTSSARFLVTAVGCLSATNTPEFPGIETFAGESYHTGAWPHEGVDFTGKRVAVIGTGATAVQAVPEIAKEAAHVWVFQRTPNYDIPGRNRPLASDYAAEVKAAYKDLWQKARESGFGLPYQVIERSADRWVAHHNEVAGMTLLLGTDSWWVGANIPGKPRTLYPYVGGVGAFRALCQEVAEKDYEGLVLSRHEAPAAASVGGFKRVWCRTPSR